MNKQYYLNQVPLIQILILFLELRKLKKLLKLATSSPSKKKCIYLIILSIISHLLTSKTFMSKTGLQHIIKFLNNAMLNKLICSSFKLAKLILLLYLCLERFMLGDGMITVK